MLEGKKIGVVVPTHDEELLISRVVETMPDYVDRIFIVDDVSHDRTVEVVQSYLQKPEYRGRLELIRHEVNRGVGAAIITGYRQAVRDGMEVVAVMAGDAQMDPNDLKNVVMPVVRDEVDYTKGNRLFSGDAWNIIPRYRYLGNSFLSLFTKIASGYWHLADSQTGYTAISAQTIGLLPLEKLYSRYGYPNHMLVMLNVYNQRVRDVPVRPIYNIGERSEIRIWKVVPRLSWLLLKTFLWRIKEKYIIRDFHPLIFFYLLGAVMLLASLVLFIRLVIIWAVTGLVPSINFLALIFTTFSGLQAIVFAMWFDMDYNKNLR